MTIIYTTAPDAYDGFSTRTINENAGTDKRGQTVRKVEIEETDVLWQTGRYASGMHAAADEEEAEGLFQYGLWTRPGEEHNCG